MATMIDADELESFLNSRVQAYCANKRNALQGGDYLHAAMWAIREENLIGVLSLIQTIKAAAIELSESPNPQKAS